MRSEFDLLFALRTDTVTEISLGMSGDIDFYLGPISLVVTDLFAPRTDRDQPLKLAEFFFLCLAEGFPRFDLFRYVDAAAGISGKGAVMIVNRRPTVEEPAVSP